MLQVQPNGVVRCDCDLLQNRPRMVEVDSGARTGRRWLRNTYVPLLVQPRLLINLSARRLNRCQNMQTHARFEGIDLEEYISHCSSLTDKATPQMEPSTCASSQSKRALRVTRVDEL